MPKILAFSFHFWDQKHCGDALTQTRFAQNVSIGHAPGRDRLRGLFGWAPGPPLQTPADVPASRFVSQRTRPTDHGDLQS